ncbi:MAG TPA: ABC transporter substrate-binding protein, partial [Alphaproteobacteria bacterium]|nr:ABC transporter substrate-binding protein [Alphaproteobacteria bacterium]
MKLGRLGLATLLAGAALALGIPAQGARAAEQGKPGGTLVTLSTQVPRHFNPAVQSGVATMAPGGQIFATLVRADANWKFHPYLAKSWTVSDDGLTVTFNLVHGAKFHDGQPITSKDVAYSVAVQKANHPFKTALGAVETVETPDPYTAVFKLRRPHPVLLLAVSTVILPIIPQHIYDDGQDIKTHPRNTKDVVGSGPFILKEYKQGEYYTLEKNPDFFIKGRPYLDRIVTRIMRDSSSEVIAMEQGEAQMLPYLSSTGDIARLKKNPKLVVTDKGYAGIGPINWLAFNTKKKPLD